MKIRTVLKSLGITSILLLSLLLSSCSAAALKNDLNKTIPPNTYEGPSRTTINYIELRKGEGTTQKAIQDKKNNVTKDKKIKVTKVTRIGNKYLITIEE